MRWRSATSTRPEPVASPGETVRDHLANGMQILAFARARAMNDDPVVLERGEFEAAMRRFEAALDLLRQDEP